MFSSVARLLSFWRMGLIEFVGEIESGGWPFPWPFVGVEAWGMLRRTNEGKEGQKLGDQERGTRANATHFSGLGIVVPTVLWSAFPAFESA